MNIGSAGSVAAMAMQGYKANLGQQIVDKTLQKGQAAQAQHRSQTRQQNPSQAAQQATAPAKAALALGKGQHINVKA